MYISNLLSRLVFLCDLLPRDSDCDQAQELQKDLPRLGALVTVTFDFSPQLSVGDSLHWDNVTQCLFPLAQSHEAVFPKASTSEHSSCGGSMNTALMVK